MAEPFSFHDSVSTQKNKAEPITACLTHRCFS